MWVHLGYMLDSFEILACSFGAHLKCIQIEPKTNRFVFLVPFGFILNSKLNVFGFVSGPFGVHFEFLSV